MVKHVSARVTSIDLWSMYILVKALFFLFHWLMLILHWFIIWKCLRHLCCVYLKLKSLYLSICLLLQFKDCFQNCGSFVRGDTWERCECAWLQGYHTRWSAWEICRVWSPSCLREAVSPEEQEPQVRLSIF